MSLAKEPFFHCIRCTLRAALCTQAYVSDLTDCDTTPEVELHDGALTANTTGCSTLHGNPIRLQWTQGDECCIETTYNSTRVSFWFAAAHQEKDPLTTQLLTQYVSFFSAHGAATAVLPVLRCVPVLRPSEKGVVMGKEDGRYDVSFLVLPAHVADFGRDAIIDFILTFVRNVEADVAGLKVSLNARRRAAAHAFFASPVD